MICHSVCRSCAPEIILVLTGTVRRLLAMVKVLGDARGRRGLYPGEKASSRIQSSSWEVVSLEGARSSQSTRGKEGPLD